MSEKNPDPTLLLDIGNTSIHAGFATDTLKDSFRVLRGELNRIDERWSHYHPDAPPAKVLLASVNPEIEQEVRAFIKSTWSQTPVRFGTDLPVPIEVNTSTPEGEVGDDRLLNATAVAHRYPSACIVVDCGTAVTFDVITSDGAFDGGVIAPGITISAKALHDNTAMLPEISPAPTKKAFGKNTEEAIQSGIYHGFTGMVRHILHQIKQETEGDPLIIGLGGDVKLFDHPEQLFDEIDMDLTLKGLLDAHSNRFC